MKRSNFIFTVIFTWVVISFCSCSKSETEVKQEQVFPTSFELIKNQKLGEAGIFTPRVVSIKGDQAVIGFLPSARMYSILLTDETSRSCVAFLQEAIKTRKPLKVFTLQSSNEIGKIEQLSKEDEKTYALDTTPEIGSRATLERYVPDMQTLQVLSDMCTYNIDYDYTGDGCFARAHEMRRIINDSGYECDKIFIFGKFKPGVEVGSGRLPSLGVYNYAGSCCSRWYYHVVPVVYFGNAEHHETIVLAPQIMTEGEWIGSCIDYTCFPFYSNNQLIDGDYDMVCIESGNVFYMETHAKNPQTQRYYDDDYRLTDYVLDLCKGRVGCDPL